MPGGRRVLCTPPPLSFLERGVPQVLARLKKLTFQKFIWCEALSCICVLQSALRVKLVALPFPKTKGEVGCKALSSIPGPLMLQVRLCCATRCTIRTTMVEVTGLSMRPGTEIAATRQASHAITQLFNQGPPLSPS